MCSLTLWQVGCTQRYGCVDFHGPWVSPFGAFKKGGFTKDYTLEDEFGRFTYKSPMKRKENDRKTKPAGNYVPAVNLQGCTPNTWWFGSIDVSPFSKDDILRFHLLIFGGVFCYVGEFELGDCYFT